ncbi:hypothetical protein CHINAEXTREME_07510 [Halobiforma lacisalsi AJ5]|uniref:DUF7981 domain-containing protein n=1 Tax=Natronobacterium lacisalsi AJ5 TaxID=358396 RepID=M0LU67_NATLA|nr:hypothetical protein [Halobiforma lacisalsi]APW97627.1 hypothetical protein CHINAEXTREME_07510 [Halobiforma lacisalsi AJ5]EMA36986.1 hypothetical protein C445_02051 [Halobiforma lacisalsi AJ5]
MDPRTKSALLWGAVGFMTFLVLVQGYALLVEPLLTLPRGAAVAALVGAATTASAYVLEPRLAARSARVGGETEAHGDDKSKS